VAWNAKQNHFNLVWWPGMQKNPLNLG